MPDEGLPDEGLPDAPDTVGLATGDGADRSAGEEFRKLILELTPGDVALVTILAEALREGAVTVTELQGLTGEEWMWFIASRRAA